jgi:hypothetical protein
MNRKDVRLHKLAIEKKITSYGIRADKLDATVKRKIEELSGMTDGSQEVINANQAIARLQIQLIKVNAEYDSFVRKHNRLTDVTLANRKTTINAETNRPTGSHQSIQPT